ncbi:MAG: glycosyltransferase family 39 protein [Patescibacteria group bacterium]|nr:glycosyltransferase family 39 protein [Patescibacteria group bacterium]
MIAKLKKFIKRYWLLGLLILIGGFLRFYKLLPSLQFLGDQGRDALVLKRILIDRDLVFLGPITSVGDMYLGPFYYYLMAPFLYFFKYNPAGPAYATTFIGLITIPILYYVTKKMFSKKAAIYASILYTLGSVPITQTRGAWNPNPMPLVALGILYSLYQSIYKKNPKHLWLFGLSLAIAFQLHYMIVFLTPFLIWQTTLILKNKKTRKYFLYSILIFLFLNLPLILFEVKNNLLNSRGLNYYFQTNDYDKFNIFKLFKDMIGRSQEVIGMLLGFGEKPSLLRTWISGFILAALTYFLTKKPKKELILISVWVLSSIVTLSFYRGLIYPHYLGFVMPIVYILIGFLLSKFNKILLLIPITFLYLFANTNCQSLRQIYIRGGFRKPLCIKISAHIFAINRST